MPKKLIRPALKLLTCTSCGWVHFGRTLAEVFEEITAFNEYYWGLSSKERKEWYRSSPSSIRQYISCFRCGAPFEQMRKYSKKTDCNIMGHTIQPILFEQKKKVTKK